MNQGGIFTKEWSLALLLALVFFVGSLADFSILEKLERVSYDIGVSMNAKNFSPSSTEKVVIIAIDDASIERIGRWPWSRSVLATMLQKLSKAKAKVIGLQIGLTEPQEDAGLRYLKEIKKALGNKQSSKVKRLIAKAERELDADGRLARAIPAARNLYMPMFFNLGEPLGNPDKALPDYIKRTRLTRIKGKKDAVSLPLATTKVIYPMAKFARHTSGVGHITRIQDADGGVRVEPLLLDYYGDYYPSMSLLMAARSLNLRTRNIKVLLGEGVKLGRLFIKTDPNMLMHTGFYLEDNGASPFSTYPFYEVYNGKIPAAVFRNKIVIIGPTATGLGSTLLTPVTGSMHAPELTANIVTSILNQNFYTRPDWVKMVELGLLIGVLAYLMFIMPRLGAGLSAFISFSLLMALVVIGLYFLIGNKIWLKSMTPALFLFTGHLVLTTRRFLTTERLKEVVESDSAQSNRMLGLSFQSQGQLDMALDKFRKLPVDESVLELFYNLALDFERKRQFSKAASAYDYILKHDKRFRDVADRKKRAQQVDGTIIMGAAGVAAGTMVLDASDQKPTLGRYEVEKELGKGAMGVVYLGKDPKINRTVAIKTMALSAEFEGNELDDVKKRFFREAETAGRLNHPNIVTIYDAGEEHDLAYIAMEFLPGRDLSDYVSKDDLPDVAWVLDIIAEVADALHYAHKMDVVHRDIKPANIMYNEEDGTLKVTDFGIARITASSKTKTGVVLGTPSYMSPEQLSGKHVDGRSDLFSMGVMMFELLTGVQPFHGDSMATLMYQIANEKHADINKIRDGLPPCVRTIINKLLEKDQNKRYQTGEEVLAALEKCAVKAA